MIVTCKLLGGLGNNLFQICCLISYALKHGIDYCIPETIEHPHEPGQRVFHSDKLNYCHNLPPGYTQYHMEQSFNYEEIAPPVGDKIFLSGYFQSYKYFNDYRAEILTLLNIPKAIGYGRVFLHYRLSDYRHLEKFHKVISDEYIDAALKLFYDKGHRDIMVFSDEPAAAKEKFTGDTFKWHFSEGRTPLQDLSLMAACAGGIMSASAFSWFGAWLGHQDRLITYPKDWFGPELNHSIVDLCPPEWQAL